MPPNILPLRYFPHDANAEMAAYTTAAKDAGYQVAVDSVLRVRCELATPVLREGDAGIDVSLWQRQVDWPPVRASGATFVFIKACEGTTPDPRSDTHWAGATGARLNRGWYMFFRPDVSPARQVDTLCKIADKHGWGELRPAVDLEIGTGFPAHEPERWLALANDTLELLTLRYGKPVYVYTNGNALQRMFVWYTLKARPAWWKYPLWVARYHPSKPPLLPPGWSDWHIHQWDGGANPWSTPQPGVAGRCDKNRWKQAPVD